MIGAIGGAAIMGLFGPADGSMFALYSIGLLVGMALYLILSLVLNGKKVTGNTLGEEGPNRGNRC